MYPPGYANTSCPSLAVFDPVQHVAGNIVKFLMAKEERGVRPANRRAAHHVKELFAVRLFEIDGPAEADRPFDCRVVGGQTLAPSDDPTLEFAQRIE